MRLGYASTVHFPNVQSISKRWISQWVSISQYSDTKFHQIFGTKVGVITFYDIASRSVPFS